jgi:hypothetical protein
MTVSLRWTAGSSGGCSECSLALKLVDIVVPTPEKRLTKGNCLNPCRRDDGACDSSGLEILGMSKMTLLQVALFRL